VRDLSPNKNARKEKRARMKKTAASAMLATVFWNITPPVPSMPASQNLTAQGGHS